MKPVNFELGWTHLSHLPLADPGFGRQGRVNILLRADVFVEILGQGRRKGPVGSPTAFVTDFGWVLCGGTGSTSIYAQANIHITTFHSSVTSTDDILRKFWEIEESPFDQVSLSIEEHTVICHFETHHSCSMKGRFVVPLPKNSNATHRRVKVTSLKDISLIGAFSEPEESLPGLQLCHARVYRDGTCWSHSCDRLGEANWAYLLSANACCIQGNKHHHKDQGSFWLFKIFDWSVSQWHAPCWSNCTPQLGWCSSTFQIVPSGSHSWCL